MKRVLMLICLLLASLAFAGPPPPAPPKPAPVCVPKWECHCVGVGVCDPGSIRMRCTDGCGHGSIGGAALMETLSAVAKGASPTPSLDPKRPAPVDPCARECAECQEEDPCLAPGVACRHQCTPKACSACRERQPKGACLVASLDFVPLAERGDCTHCWQDCTAGESDCGAAFDRCKANPPTNGEDCDMNRMHCHTRNREIFMRCRGRVDECTRACRRAP